MSVIVTGLRCKINDDLMLNLYSFDERSRSAPGSSGSCRLRE